MTKPWISLRSSRLLLLGPEIGVPTQITAGVILGEKWSAVGEEWGDDTYDFYENHKVRF